MASLAGHTARGPEAPGCALLPFMYEDGPRVARARNEPGWGRPQLSLETYLLKREVASLPGIAPGGFRGEIDVRSGLGPAQVGMEPSGDCGGGGTKQGVDIAPSAPPP